MRRETNLHIEKRELDALAALANGERKAAMIIQGAVRKWMLTVYARKEPEQVRRIVHSFGSGDSETDVVSG